MTTPNDGGHVLPVLDDPPRDGTFAPEVAELDLTEEEIAAGNTLGRQIDIFDDHDGGGA